MTKLDNYNPFCKVVCVVSTVSDSNYGTVEIYPNKLIYTKHKAILINKNQKSPKICTEIQKTSKEISNSDFQKYFRISNPIEISILEMLEEKQLFSSKN